MELAIGDATYDVRDFGARGDGKADDTAAVQKALDACAKTAGGTVVVPKGFRFLIYSVAMRVSRVVLSVEGELVLGGRRAFYERTGNASAVIIVGGGKAEISDVAIAGGGTIDGVGSDWWAHRDDFRPHMVDAKGITRLLVHDVTFLNPPSHCLELSATFVELSRVNVFAPPSTDVALESHNTDAYDVHGAYAYVHGVNFTTGDDDVALHANHTLVENSYFGTGHGASVGSLCGSWVTNVTVRGVAFRGTTGGARIKTHPKCGGRVWDVLYENLTMVDVQSPIDIDMFYPGDGNLKKTTMRVENITFRDITSTGHKYDGSFSCDPDSPCRGLVFHDVNLKQDKDEWRCKKGKGDDCCAHASGTGLGVAPSGLNDCLKHSASTQ